MMQNLRYLGVIVGRGGSKRLPRKNIALLDGVPLIGHTISAAKASRRLSKSIVSTDDVEIAEVSRGLGAQVPFIRPLELARDDSSVVDVLRHAVSFEETTCGSTIGAVVLLQATSPFRTAEHIDQAIELFESKHADTVTAVCASSEHPYWTWQNNGDELVPFFSREHVGMDRSQLPGAYIENGALYVIRRDLLIAGEFYGDRVIPLVMDSRESVDVDTKEDLLWAEFMMARRD